ncbi:hypothetical protein LCGC14_1760770 [marine sediment metagenome]|uniref:Uncharacterized protein n=1 Tax=marine sediment metagenome TaxID=412755 RepID=A0A0F9K0T7_9ZZZZ
MPKCAMHSIQYRLWDTCPKCGEAAIDESRRDEAMKNAAGKLFKACEQARYAIRQVGTAKTPNIMNIIKRERIIRARKQILAEAEQACDEAIQLALRGE